MKARKIWITCGTGGVGKTTTSAALGIHLALQGKRTLVVTMDPAKRLATSLGIAGIGNEPKDLTNDLGNALGTKPTGEFWALMPDTRRTMEEFVRELAPDERIAQRVLGNPIFQIFAREFSGTNEYMALERLYVLNKDPRFDCIVLDTPPSRNTVHFLEAPKLLARFFEEKLIRWLVMPANRFFGAGMKKALGILERLTGAGFMTALVEFAADLFQVQARFVANLGRISALLESEDVGFLVVSSPQPQNISELAHFTHTLKDRRLHADGLILNRALGQLGPAKPESSPAELKPALEILKALQEQERRATGELSRLGIPLLAQVPELARDVHSLSDLGQIARILGQGMKTP